MTHCKQDNVRALIVEAHERLARVVDSNGARGLLLRAIEQSRGCGCADPAAQYDHQNRERAERIRPEAS